MDSKDDSQLIVEAARGSRDALGELYDRHAPAVANVARRFLGTSAEVDDLVHDVFLEAWSRAGDFDPSRGTVRAWLLVRARSRCLDRKRSASSTRKRALEIDPLDPATRPDGVEMDVDCGRLRVALERLPVDQRSALLLGVCEGLSSTEIAARLDIPVGTVKSRVHAAMQKLRSELADSPAGFRRSDPVVGPYPR